MIPLPVRRQQYSMARRSGLPVALPCRSSGPLPILGPLLILGARAVPLVNPGSLFTFRFPCRKRKTLWPPASAPLDDACRLPSLAAIVGVPDLVSLWLAWNDGGLRVRGEMKGVGASRWCQPTRPEDSDGLQLWIATRPTGESHRA